MGKSPISMAMFNSYVKLPEGTNGGNAQVSYQPSFAGFHKWSFLAWEHVYLHSEGISTNGGWTSMNIDEHGWTLDLFYWRILGGYGFDMEAFQC